MEIRFEPRVWPIRPRNASKEGIHDDETAKRLGFVGAFVPGVTLYENLVIGLLEHDPRWLEHGRVEMHFRGPVYDGEEVDCRIKDDGVTWEIKGESDERARAYGVLDFGDAPPPAVSTGTSWPRTGNPLGDPAQLGTIMDVSFDISAERIAAAAEASGFHRVAPSAIVPVGLWTNPVDLLHDWFDCPTTIHYSSRIWHFSPLLKGEILHKRGELVGFEDRRGNQVASFTAELTVGDRRVATIAHQSVYQLAKRA